jgi:hypothetical protein
MGSKGPILETKREPIYIGMHSSANWELQIGFNKYYD